MFKSYKNFSLQKVFLVSGNDHFYLKKLYTKAYILFIFENNHSYMKRILL